MAIMRLWHGMVAIEKAKYYPEDDNYLLEKEETSDIYEDLSVF